MHLQIKPLVLPDDWHLGLVNDSQMLFDRLWMNALVKEE